MSDNPKKAEHVYKGIVEYCRTYNIPRENLLDILEDQKVLPMIRGKASEYVGAAFLRHVLDPREWIVDKLNLNPQRGRVDQDIRITFRRTGASFNAETKNATRASFKLNRRRKFLPHFTVKCHKSRSNLRLQRTTNDRYLVGEFDLLLCNVSNAIFRGRHLGPGLPLIEDTEATEWLMDFYQVSDEQMLIRKAYDDWRLCLPVTIAEPDGAIPRTPLVKMTDDENWFGPDDLAANLKSLVNGISA